eukprot:3931316-Prymnesium_polylepis.2
MASESVARNMVPPLTPRASLTLCAAKLRFSKQDRLRVTVRRSSGLHASPSRMCSPTSNATWARRLVP